MIRLAIVGLGRMGASYPDVGGVPRSHLAAAAMTPGVTVVALADPDAARRDEAAARAPQALLLPDISGLPDGHADVLIDARPPSDRALLARMAKAKGARAVVFEKPLATELDGARLVAQAVAETGLTARINFHRRFDARFRAARAALSEAPIAVSAYYAKGLVNYGSHVIDLILDWMGPVEAVRAVGDKFGAEDSSIGFDLRFADGRLGTVRALEADFDVFEVTFFTRRARIDIRNGGTHMMLASAVHDLVYPGYSHLAPDALGAQGVPVSGLAELYHELAAHLAGTASLGGATIDDALTGMAIISAVWRSDADGGSWQNVSL